MNTDTCDILSNVYGMSPEECKAMIRGFEIGLKFANETIKYSIELERLRGNKDKENQRDVYPFSYNNCRNNSYGSYNRRGRDITRQDFRKIKLEFYVREDASEVLDILRDRLKDSSVNYVDVEDLYHLAELPINSTMREWVWYDLEDCRIYREGDYYILEMPPAERRPEPKKDRASDIS